MKTIAVSDATHEQLTLRKLQNGQANLDAVIRDLLGWARPSDRLRSAARTLSRIATRHHVKRLRLFGSGARGEDLPSSDLDLLVDFAGPHDLLDLAGFQEDLAEALRCRVDATTQAALHPKLRGAILAEATEVWRAK
ncbi:MAG: nucleotidyltransferase family protein [Thermoplasmatota archaeon]|nr:nucleotidyltransferase family protein [Halobacteriales archaeon]